MSDVYPIKQIVHGPAADRPAAGAIAEETLYIADDTGDQSLHRDGAWQAAGGGGGAALALTTVTANYAVQTTDQTILVAASGTTITLPAAASVPAGTAFDIKNTTAGDTTTVATAGGDIDGAATYTGLAAANAAVRVVSDSVNYWIL